MPVGDTGDRIVLNAKEGGDGRIVIRAVDGGITALALETWDAFRNIIKRVERVDFGFDPIESDDVTTIIHGENIVLMLTGTNCGYGGEGPHGSLKILRDLGVPEELARRVFSQRRITFMRAGQGWIVYDKSYDEAGLVA